MRMVEGLDHQFDPVEQPYDPKERIAIFIDGANLFYSALQLDIEIDYIKLLQNLTQNRRLVRAYFYTGVDPDNEKQQGFLHWMRCHGYRVMTKELIQHSDGSHKADLDVEIVVDMLTLAGHCDTVVLVSGDGDLTYALDKVAYQGGRVEVVSLRSMTSDNLINIADRYTDLDAIQQDIQKQETPVRKSSSVSIGSGTVGKSMAG